MDSVGILHFALVEPDGKIVLSERLASDQSSRLFRLLPDGSLDSSFAGLTIGDGVGLVARQADAWYLVASSLHTTNEQQVFQLVRLHPDGTPDPSFKIAADLFLPGKPGDFYGQDCIFALAV